MMKAYVSPSPLAEIISWTRTPIEIPLYKGMPALCRLCTALNVKRLPQTCRMDSSRSFWDRQFTPTTESCRPAPETSSRSSLFAEERTAMSVMLAGNTFATASKIFGSTLRPATAFRRSSAHPSTSSSLFSATSKALSAASKAEPCTAFDMTPKGMAQLTGVLKEHLPAAARASSCPAEDAFAPTTSGVALLASATARTEVSLRFKPPSFGAACAFGLLVPLDVDVGRSCMLICETFTSAPLLTLNESGFPSGIASASCLKRPDSEVHAKVTFICRALTARWLRTGRSLFTTTPLQPGGISSSPVADSQKMMAPSAGSFCFQTSCSADAFLQRPAAEP
mmetsp:Transcript_16737/g.29283  ORF Transcript_16737/g.29283 Transcript_16737/m.29283 type:complete len:338 (-) Transcript_16737:1742-2755(-)